MENKKKSKANHRKNQEKDEFESLGMSPWCSWGGTPIVL